MFLFGCSCSIDKIFKYLAKAVNCVKYTRTLPGELRKGHIFFFDQYELYGKVDLDEIVVLEKI